MGLRKIVLNSSYLQIFSFRKIVLTFSENEGTNVNRKIVLMRGNTMTEAKTLIEVRLNPGRVHKPIKWVMLFQQIDARFPEARVEAGFDARIVLYLYPEEWKPGDSFFDNLVRAELLEGWRYYIRGKALQA